VAALAAAANVGRLDDPDWRMACALGSTHRLFQVLVPDMARRLVMCHDIAEHAMAEVAHTPEQIAARRLQLSRVFREQRHALAVAVFDHQGEWTSVTGIWEQFASVVAPSADALRELDAEGALLTPYDDIVCSILHMHLNRVFVEEPRHHERIAYEFLYKLYKGRSARQHADPIHLATK
jgi:thiopeptide-type bacteriocin biosynthesis protein